MATGGSFGYNEEYKGREDTDGRKFTGTEMRTLVDQLEKVQLHKFSKADMQTLLRHWSHPNGKIQPAMVLCMNKYVDDPDQKVFIPGEIALCAFSIEKGLHPKSFWSLVDPADEIPKGHGCEAYQNSCGLPHPCYSEDFQDYKKIAGEIEAFINNLRTTEPIYYVDDEDGSTKPSFVLFCLSENVNGYKQGLEWLYEQAEMKFVHEVMALEKLLVVLSVGGLESIAQENGDIEMDFPRILDEFNKTVSTVTSLASAGSSKMSIHSTLQTFMSQVTRTSPSLYSSIGNSTRMSYTCQPDKYAFAILGAFIFEEQATSFMRHMDYVYMESLSCDFHTDNWRSFQGGLAQWIRTRKGENRPSEHMTKCALTHAHKQIFLALDVIMVNYDVRPRSGRHYPKPEPTK